jgi:hypothetical protein
MSHSQPPFSGQDPYQQPPPGFPPQGYQMPLPPKRKRHIVRNVLLGGTGLVAVIIAIAAVAGGGKTPVPAASTPAPAATASAPPSPSPSAAALAAPKKHVLIRFTGSGIENSAPFNVGSSPLTVHYSFNCASMGQAGNFIADLLYGNQANFSSDDQSIANDLAMSGAQTTTVYPQDAGKGYHLAVNSECDWRIRVSS